MNSGKAAFPTLKARPERFRIGGCSLAHVTWPGLFAGDGEAVRWFAIREMYSARVRTEWNASVHP
jgi:hypothetical protein